MGFNSCGARLLVFLLLRGITSWLTLVERKHSTAEKWWWEGCSEGRDALLTASMQWGEQRYWSLTEQLSNTKPKNKK